MAKPLSYEHELIDAIPVPVFFLDTNGTFIGSNVAFNTFVGMSDDEVGEKGIYNMLVPNSIEKHKEIDRILLERGYTQPFEDEAIGSRGRLYNVIFRKSLIHDSEGRITGVVTTINDLTDLKDAEKALLASESQKKAILDGFPGTIILFDVNLTAIWVNDTIRRTVDKPIGKLCPEIICGNNKGCKNCAVPRSVRTGKVSIGTQRIESPDSGHDIFYEVIGTPVKGSEGTIESVIVIARDITERYKLEKQLRHAQKMEAIGTLAGGIAHDFNNVLTPIMGYSEIIKLKMKQEGFEDDVISEYLGEILDASKRAKSLVDQILAFSRSSEQKESLQYLHPIVKEVIKLMRVTLPTTIQINHDINESCRAVSVDPVQIHQVLINLCTNSADAIGDNHGVLSVKLKNAESDVVEEKDWIELVIEDSGCGMSQDLRERVFEPYFTTKEKERGTGMGLALVHSIITRHGGRIELDSEENVGTTFRIYLPPAKKVTTLNQIVSSEEIIEGQGNVLLVDDESQVVRVTSELLGSLGYRVTGRSSPVEALQDFRNNPDDFDLLLTDLTMPKLTGLELSSEIKKIRPGFPVILFTGYSERLTAEEATRAGIDKYCMKPVSFKDLSQAVGDLILKHVDTDS